MELDIAQAAAPRAVLFDRDGTLIADVPYNADPGRVRVLPTVVRTVATLRRRGIPVGVVSNQSGIARGVLDTADVTRIALRIEEETGPFDVWEICPHAPEDGCTCRKPKPGMIVSAARRLSLTPAAVAVVGDIGSDMDAARAAGARAVLVPTRHTRTEEVDRAPAVAASVAGAVALLFGAGGLP